MSFATPAEENLAETITLDSYCIEHPDRSFMLKVTSDAMRDAGIHAGDMLIVERATEPRRNDIVIISHGESWAMRHYSDLASGAAVSAVVKAVIRKYE